MSKQSGAIKHIIASSDDYMDCVAAIFRDLAKKPPEDPTMQLAIKSAVNPELPCVCDPETHSFDGVMEREAYRRIQSVFLALANMMESGKRV